MLPVRLPGPFLIICILCALSLAAQTPFEDPGGRFVVDLPSTWQLLAQPDGDTYLLPLSNGRQCVLRFYDTEKNLAAIAVEGRAELLRLAKDAAFGSASELQVSGHSARWATFSFGVVGGVALSRGTLLFVTAGPPGDWHAEVERVFRSARDRGQQAGESRPLHTLSASDVDAPPKPLEKALFVHPFVTLTLPSGWSSIPMPRTTDEPRSGFAWLSDRRRNWLRIYCDRGDSEKDAYEHALKTLRFMFEDRTPVQEKLPLMTAGGAPGLFGLYSAIGVRRHRRTEFRIVVAGVKYGDCGLALRGIVPAEQADVFVQQAREVVASARPGDAAASTSGRAAATMPDKVHAAAVPVSDSTLGKHAALQPAELWRIPLGRSFVERMTPVARNRLFVVVRHDVDGMPMRDLMAVDPASGKTVWRYAASETQATPQGDVSMPDSDGAAPAKRDSQAASPEDKAPAAVPSAQGDSAKSQPASAGAGKTPVGEADANAEAKAPGDKKRLRTAIYDPFFIGADAWVFLLSFDDRDSALLALDPATGDQKWFVLLPKATVLLNREAGLAISVRPWLPPTCNGKYCDIDYSVRAVRLADGTDAWKKEFHWDARDGRGPAVPIITGRDTIVFSSAIERISPEGKPVWSRADLRASGATARPAVAGNELLFIDSDRNLVALDTHSGASRWKTPLPPDRDPSSISAGEEFIYVRGLVVRPTEDEKGRSEKEHKKDKDMKHEYDRVVVEPSEETVFSLAAFRPSDGKRLWEYTSPDPSSSNIIEGAGRVFFATPQAVVSLDASTGRQLWTTKVTDRDSDYPVRLRPIGANRLAFIGELTVAAVNTEGDRIYSWDFDPIGAEGELTGLDEMARAWDWQIGFLRMKPPHLMSISESRPDWQRSRSFQEASASYRTVASFFQAQSNFLAQPKPVAPASTSVAAQQYKTTPEFMRLEQKAEQVQAVAAFGAALVAAAAAFSGSMASSYYQMQMQRVNLYRRSIVSSYGDSESEEFVWRPNRKDGLLRLTIVNLSSGRRRDRILGPLYRNYGLWSTVDVEGGRVYYHALPLDPALHKYAEEQKEGLLLVRRRVRILESHLAAAPLELPR